MPVWSTSPPTVDILSEGFDSVSQENPFSQDSVSSLEVQDDNNRNDGKYFLLTKWRHQYSNAKPSVSFEVPVPVIIGIVVSAAFLLYLICVFANLNNNLLPIPSILQQKHKRGNARQPNFSSGPIVISTISTSYRLTGNIPAFTSAPQQIELSVLERRSEPPPTYEECVLQMTPNRIS